MIIRREKVPVMEQRLYDCSLIGNTEALKSLIQEDELILDRDSLTCFNETPLHIAAMRGHSDFAILLLGLKPKLALELDSCGRSALHMASAEGHVQIVEDLLSLSPDLCLVRDREGRTPLHLAAMKGQVEVLRRLIQALPKSIHEKMDRGEIRAMLMESGVRRNNEVPPSSFCLHWLGKARLTLLEIWKAYDTRENEWVSKARGNLTVAATLTATMAFQAGINPPGGTWQDDKDEHVAGGAIQANQDPKTFRIFLLFNTLSLIASMSIVLLMVSGFRLKNKYAVRILVVAMCLSVGFAALAYLCSMLMLVETVNSNKEWRWYVYDIIVPVLFFWIGLCGVAIIVPLLRLFASLINPLQFILKRQK